VDVFVFLFRRRLSGQQLIRHISAKLPEPVSMKPLRVSELMQDTCSAVIAETMLLRRAAEILVAGNYVVLIVEDENGHFAGIVPEAAIVRQLMSSSRRDETVAAVLSRHVETVRSGADVHSILHLFRSSCHGVIPVVDDADGIVGLLYRSDVVRMLLGQEPVSETEPQHDRQRRPHFLDRNESPAADKPKLLPGEAGAGGDAAQC
jgi:CBS domain-containing protein